MQLDNNFSLLVTDIKVYGSNHRQKTTRQNNERKNPETEENNRIN